METRKNIGTPISDTTLREKLMEHRIEAVKDAASRSRTTWLFCISLTFICATVLFNSVCSYNKQQVQRRAALLRLVSQEPKVIRRAIRNDQGDFVKATLKDGVGELGYLKQLAPTNRSDTNSISSLRSAAADELKQYAGRQFDLDNFTIPLIGVNVSTSDMGIIGGLALIVVGLWLLAVLRRTNHAFGLFVQRKPGGVIYESDHTGYSPEEVSYAYNSINQHVVFTAVKGSTVNCLTLISFLCPPALFLINHLTTIVDTMKKGLGNYFQPHVIAEFIVMMLVFVVWLCALYIQLQIIEALQAWKDITKEHVRRLQLTQESAPNVD